MTTKPSGLRQQRWIDSQFWRLEVQSQGVTEGSGGGSFLVSPSLCLGLQKCHSDCDSAVPWPLSPEPRGLRHRMPVIGRRACLNPVRPHLNLTASAKTLYSKRVTFTGPGFKTSVYLLGEDTVQPTTPN